MLPFKQSDNSNFISPGPSSARNGLERHFHDANKWKDAGALPCTAKHAGSFGMDLNVLPLPLFCGPDNVFEQLQTIG